MRLLYLSCHAILEYDEIKLFNELGIDVFSHGVYRNPPMADDPIRPPLPIPFNKRLYDMSVMYGKENLHQDMIDWADVIVCSHVVDWLSFNWEKMKGKRVIWRSIGQSSLNVEGLLRPLREDGLEIVRYSPREKTIPGFVGEDAMIRFYKDPDEFKGWTGEKKAVLTVSQSMKERDEFCNWTNFEFATRGFERVVHGRPSKCEDPLWGGQLTYDELKKAYRDFRVYFYTGTYPASYTLNFIEAWMTGIPIVALGRRLGSSPHEVGQDTYEVPDFLDETGGGMYSDDLEELKRMIRVLMEDLPFAQKVSERARAGALKYFAKDVIKEEWRRFLNV